MQSLAKRKEQKKAQSNIIICPRCGAGNLTSQSVCGRCGFVFPKEKVVVKGRKGEFGDLGKAGKDAQHLGNKITEQGMDYKDGEDGEGASIEAQKIPKLQEKGVIEGIRKDSGGFPLCPRCGAEIKEGMARCPRCGYKKK
jgi:ribosomal protein L40E